MNTKQKLAVVDNMLAYYSGPEKWTQEVLGLDAKGGVIRTDSELIEVFSEGFVPQCLCLEGCITYSGLVTPGQFTPFEAYTAIARDIRSADLIYGRTILFRWNDASERTFDDVINLLHKLRSKLLEEV